MQEGGMHTDEYNEFLKEASGNVANDGMFSSQVLAKALEVWGLEVVPLDSPAEHAARQEPSQQSAFICNHEVGVAAQQVPYSTVCSKATVGLQNLRAVCSMGFYSSTIRSKAILQ
jgi:hypothetical protein